VFPLSVILPVFDDAHTVVLPLTVPPTLAGFTVIVADDELADAQTPLVTTALYNVVCVKFEYACEAVIFAMGLQLAPPLIDDSQRVTAPVLPVKFNVPEFEVAHTVELLLTLPPTETGLTVIVTLDEFAAAQTPLCTCARYRVVCVRLL
jgi:ABC-type molybdate transport system permease subunit